MGQRRREMEHCPGGRVGGYEGIGMKPLAVGLSGLGYTWHSEMAISWWSPIQLYYLRQSLLYTLFIIIIITSSDPEK